MLSKDTDRFTWFPVSVCFCSVSSLHVPGKWREWTPPPLLLCLVGWGRGQSPLLGECDIAGRCFVCSQVVEVFCIVPSRLVFKFLLNCE